jgi:lipoprotein-anchoring transpeptidase ErfK/SrfK
MQVASPLLTYQLMSMKTTAVAALLVVAAACSREQAHQAKESAQNATQKVAQKVQDAFDATVPLGKPDDPAAREQQRFDQRWRQLQSFKIKQQQQQRQQQAQQPANVPAPQPEQPLQFVTAGKESFKGMTPEAINAAPLHVPITGDVTGPSVLKAQVWLDRLHFSVGVMDGRWGRNSAITVWWWQRAHGMAETGDVDEATFRSIAQAAGYAPPLTRYTVTAGDLKGPFVHIPDSPYEKAKLDCLCYESVREELAERFHATEDFLALLNPGVKFSDLQAGQQIVVPNVRPWMTDDHPDIAKVVISVAGNSFSAFDANNNLIFHAPTTLGSTYDPSPDETVKVVKIVWHPHFHYDPTLYHEVPDSEPDAMMSPGPNSPVGVVWMALSKQHYGMHGNPDPESIGYASSHGCVRLTNWDAQEVAHRIHEGVLVSFVDTSDRNVADVAKK